MTVTAPPLPTPGASNDTWGQIIDDAITSFVSQVSNIDNTSDLNKPISTATAAALAAKAPIGSPAFTGVPSAPTAAKGTNSTQLATTEFVLTNAGPGATVADASPVVKGLIQLAGDLTGTAVLPQLKQLRASAVSVGSTVKNVALTIDTAGRVTAATEVASTASTDPSGNALATTAAAQAMANIAQAQVSRALAVTASTYTLVVADGGGVVEMNNAAANTVTVPAGVLPANTVVEVYQLGAGQTSIVAGAGVTLQPSTPMATRAQFSSLFLRHRGNDVWAISGDSA